MILRALLSILLTTSFFLRGVHSCSGACLQSLESHLNTTAPIIILGSLSSTTVRVTWRLPDRQSWLTYDLIVGRSLPGEKAGQSLQSAPGHWLVYDLVPSGEYKFWVAAYNGAEWLGNSRVSAGLLMKDGDPPSPPRILGIKQMIHLHVNISWKPPVIVQSKIVAYSIGIHGLSSNSKKPLYEGTLDYSVDTEKIDSDIVYHHVLLLPSMGMGNRMNYNITIRAVNVDGIMGDPAYKSISYSSPDNKKDYRLDLYYFLRRNLFCKSLTVPSNLFASQRLVLQHSMDISSLSPLESKNLLFFLDVSGTLWIFSVLTKTSTKVIIKNGIIGSEMSVDWLYHKIYILDNNRLTIHVCRLPMPDNPILGDCSDMKVSGSRGPLRDLKVDPYHGLVHFIDKDKVFMGISYHGETLLRVETETRIGSYGLQVSEGSIVLSGRNQTIFIDAMTGNQRVQKGLSFKGDISSLIVNENSTSFFWSNDHGINYGEVSEKGLSQVAIDASMHPPALIPFREQPTPLPLGPPRNVQAILFGDSKGSTELKWEQPPSPGYLGAWADWKYRVRVLNLRHNSTSNLSNVTCCSTSILSLNQSTLYRVDVRVENEGGLWSKATVFGTLDEYPAECVIATNTQSLIHYNSLLPRKRCQVEAWELDFNIVEISGPIGLTDGGRIVKGYPPKELSNISGRVESITYDSVASMLYISRDNKLSRYNLVNNESEELIRGVRATRISSSFSRLCWSSYSTLLCSRLNGRDPKLVFEDPDQHILTFCLQDTSNNIYFLTSDKKALKYRLVHIIESRASVLWTFHFYDHHFKPDMKMSCFSHKVIWLSESSGLFVYDLLGDSLSSLPVNHELSSFAIIKPPETLNKTIPPLPMLPKEQVSVSGRREAFNVSWGALNPPALEYCISINDNPYTSLTTGTFHVLNPTNSPFFNVSLYVRNDRTFSPALNFTLSPPESLPYPPKDPRYFLFGKTATLRWSPPSINNGVILLYRIHLAHGKFVEVNGSGESETVLSLDDEFDDLMGISSVNSKGSSDLAPFSRYDHEVPKVIYLDNQRNARLLDVDTQSNNVLRANVDFYEYLDSSIDIWVVHGGIYSEQGDSGIKRHYEGPRTIKIFLVHWLSRSFIWSENGIDFRMAYMDDAEGREPRKLFRSPEMVVKAFCVPKAIYLLTESGGIYEYTSSKFLNRVHINCQNTGRVSIYASPIILKNVLLGGCNKTHGYNDIVSDGKGLNFWISQYLGIIHSSYRDLNVSISPQPSNLISVYSPLARRRSLMDKYTACWKLAPHLGPEIVNKTTNEVTLRLTSSQEHPLCPFGLFTPLTSVLLSIDKIEGNNTYVLDAPSVYITLRNLSAFTSYNISLTRFNAFHTPGLHDSLYLRTLEGEPPPPRDFHGYVLTPTSLVLLWTPLTVRQDRPLTYRVQFRPTSMSQASTVSSIVETYENLVVIRDLEPNTEYLLSLSAISLRNPGVGPSSPMEIKLRTFGTPEMVVVTRVWPRRLELTWEAPPESVSPISFHQLILYPKSNASDVRLIPRTYPEVTIPSTAFTYDLQNHLSPNTEYILQLRALYESPVNTSILNEFLWPEFGSSVLTLSDAPLAPGRPYPVENGSDVILLWDEMDSNVRLYELYAQKNCGPNCEDDWQLVYRGSSKGWGHLYTLSNSEELRFKVRGENSAGWSPYSLPSKVLRGSDFLIRDDLEEKEKASNQASGGRVNGSSGNNTVLWVVLGILILLIGLGVLFRRRVLMAIQRKFPWARPELVGSNESGLSEESLCNAIPRVHISSLSFGNKIGSGAFGNVYRGRLILPPSSGGVGKEEVALKTLKPSANISTKNEFMREALIMSKFNHPNVLRLLGASLEKGVRLVLVMELMDRDLLATLRVLRSEGGILGENLLRFGLDVARGCLYLAQMRHVHRDIAARNCLVSSPTSDNSRIVKIGDFGLAREIYREDYYRKGGLMPVRWMSPESLEDGVYTHQSDVWSFGILLWEIITLGKQPYPGLSTHQVAEAVVKAGRRPAIPPFCPALLSGLMTRTWAFFADERPSFQDCVDEIEELLLYREELNSISFNSGSDDGILDPIKVPVSKGFQPLTPYLEVLSPQSAGDKLDKISSNKTNKNKILI